MTHCEERIEVCEEMMSKRQKFVTPKLAVPETPKVWGENDTRIRLSRLQKSPEGEFEPPRTGKPLTILPVATLTSLASAETQSEGSPAEQFLIRPSLP